MVSVERGSQIGNADCTSTSCSRHWPACSTRGTVRAWKRLLIERAERRRLRSHQIAGQRPDAELDEPDRVARWRTSSCSTGFRLARAGPMWTLKASEPPSTFARYVSIESAVPCSGTVTWTLSRSRALDAPVRSAAIATLSLESGHP